jgi:transposase InsO family protein
LHAQGRYKIKDLCELFGYSKQAYYKKDDQPLAKRLMMENVVLEYVRDVRSRDPGIGGRKLWLMYHKDLADRDRIGRDRFEAIISENGLLVRRRRRCKPRTTDSTHGLPLYPNLIRDVIPNAPRQIWVSDITYVPIYPAANSTEFTYLSLITDAYSHEIVGWSLGDTLSTEYPLEALQMALKGAAAEGVDLQNLIHHSDRGVQYASHSYTRMLAGSGIGISMTENGDPKENAIAERINSTVKNELLKGKRFTSLGELKEGLRTAIDFYNTRRPHMSNGMLTPAEASKCTGVMPKNWPCYREEAITRKNLEPPKLLVWNRSEMDTLKVTEGRGGTSPTPPEPM